MSRLVEVLTDSLGAFNAEREEDRDLDMSLSAQIGRAFGFEMEEPRDLLVLEEVGRQEMLLCIQAGQCFDVGLMRILATGVKIGRKIEQADQLRGML